MIEITKAPKPNFGNVKFIACVNGEILGNGQTKEAAMQDAVRRMYRGYAMHHYGTETPFAIVAKCDECGSTKRDMEVSGIADPICCEVVL